MQIENRNLSDLLPYPNNAKTHSDEQIAKIAASIKEFGFNNPVLVDNDGGIIAGHGRVDAARKLNLTELPTITLGHLTEAQKKAYILADNRLAEIGSEWDLDLVALELDQIAELDLDIDLTGFDDSLMISGEVVDFPELASGDKEPYQQMTFTLHDEQVEIVKEAITKARSGQIDSPLNDNMNGNALTAICEAY